MRSIATCERRLGLWRISHALNGTCVKMYENGMTREVKVATELTEKAKEFLDAFNSAGGRKKRGLEAPEESGPDVKKRESRLNQVADSTLALSPVQEWKIFGTPRTMPAEGQWTRPNWVWVFED